MHRLLDASTIRPDDLVADPGARRGLIAVRLARRGCRVIAVEKDPELAARFTGQRRGALISALLKPRFEPTLVHRFERTDFAPPPRVDVVVLRLRKRGSTTGSTVREVRSSERRPWSPAPSGAWCASSGNSANRGARQGRRARGSSSSVGPRPAPASTSTPTPTFTSTSTATIPSSPRRLWGHECVGRLTGDDHRGVVDGRRYQFAHRACASSRRRALQYPRHTLRWRLRVARR
jgi:hypothetical protein